MLTYCRISVTENDLQSLHLLHRSLPMIPKKFREPNICVCASKFMALSILEANLWGTTALHYQNLFITSMIEPKLERLLMSLPNRSTPYDCNEKVVHIRDTPHDCNDFNIKAYFWCTFESFCC